MRTIWLAGLLGMGAIQAAQAQVAIREFTPSVTEMQALPPYCAVKFNSKMDSPEYKAWWSQLGPNFNDIHHYCAGLNFLNRYYRASPFEKSGMLQGAKRNFEYMIKAASPEFPLRADIYLQHGITMNLMGQSGLAIKDLQQAIEINPKLAKAYLELISLYKNNKQSKQAMDAAIAGLKQIPDSKALQRNYLELGGKQPFPKPVAAVVEPPAAKVAPVEVEAKPAPPVAGEHPAVPTSTDAIGAKPEIGAPGNPYCRFCPPSEAAH